MLKTFKYRLYPTRYQTTLLNKTIRECRWLYNQLLENRRTIYKQNKTTTSLFNQQKLIPILKKSRRQLNCIFSQVLNQVAVRIDLAFQAFFCRVKNKGKPGYPRFKGIGQYNSFTYTQHGFNLNGHTLHVSKIGDIQVVLHRPIEGKTKTCTIKRSPTGKWYVSFVCQNVPNKTPSLSNEQIGIDVGLYSFATLSNKDEIPIQKFLIKDEKELKRVQSKFSKSTKGSLERNKLRKPLSHIHERISFRRNNFANQESCKIVNKFGFIAVEDLEVNRIIQDCFKNNRKSIQDAAWSLFFTLLSFKAESAGRTLVKVNPAYTSQTCSDCGHRQKMPLSNRIYNCPCCHLSIGRDHNAAINILRLGLQSTGSSKESKKPY